MRPLIFHVDANSAFLSWTAAYQVNVLGQELDLRTVPSVIAGNKETRQGIVLAKSIPAKKFGIQTGERIGQALQKCPELIVQPPDYPLYVEASRHFVDLLRSVAPVVEQYSIDEAYADMTSVPAAAEDPFGFADELRERVHKELGFTVNVGVSSDKLLAKMAGNFQKPDRVHTLFPDEIEEKLWPLGVRELFLVGPATERKLQYYGIRTIGELANADPLFLRSRLGKQGEVLWRYANGKSGERVSDSVVLNKGYGNAATTVCDVTDRDTAHRLLLSLTETVCARMRFDGQSGALVTVSLRSRDFEDFTHQRLLGSYTNVTSEVWRAACAVFDEAWDAVTPLRQLGVQVSRLVRGSCRQYDLFSGAHIDRLEHLDSTVDAIRAKYGEDAIYRACFVNDCFAPMGGGLHKSRRTGVTKPVPAG